MNKLNKKNIIGIWGLGKTGKSIITFLQSQGYSKLIAHAQTINQEQKQFLENQQVAFIENQNDFLQKSDSIIPSPGINLNQANEYHHKCVAELDIFCQFWQKPIIAVTGSIGKTTVTHILSQLLQQKCSLVTGGNIGTPMLEMVGQQADYALLELSSFQLELAKTIKPNIAILTNFYPNHLDWHPTIGHYFAAKMNLFNQMSSDQHAIIPIEQQDNFKDCTAQRHVFSDKPIDASAMKADTFYYSLHNETIIRTKKGKQDTIPFYYNDLSYPINWLIISICLHILQVKIAKEELPSIHLFEHRLEKVCSINGIAIYNDSKSTVPQATLAAVAKLQDKPIHLLLGGLGKNIDRGPLIGQLKNRVHFIYCFGKEAALLHALCQKESIHSYSFATLDEALSATLAQAKPGEQILFSPAGASFDLFENYEKRGEYFKKLVQNLVHESTIMF